VPFERERAAAEVGKEDRSDSAVVVDQIALADARLRPPEVVEPREANRALALAELGVPGDVRLRVR